MSVKARKLNFKYICINKYQISRNNINFNLIQFFNMQEIYNENFIYICIYIYILAVLGLCCCTGFSLVAASGGYSLVVSGLFIAVASLVEHRL